MRTFKHNTFNVNNIEEVAICYDDPETILLEREEMDRAECILETAIERAGLTNIDRLVLSGEINRIEAAKRSGMNYDAYRKKLYRKIRKVESIIDRQ